MPNFEKQLLEKVDRLLAADCPTCSTRDGVCHSCGRPVGPSADEAQQAREALDAVLIRLNERMSCPDGLLRGM